MKFTFSFTLTFMVAVAVIVSTTSSAPIAANANNNSGDLTPRADFQPRGIWRQPRRIPEQPQPVKKRDDHDYDNIVNSNKKESESEIAYKFPIGDICIMKPRDGSDSGSHTSDNDSVSPYSWCPPQTHRPEPPKYWT
ncbi:hypothetical protein BGZ96_000110 [Linnemannia gamsii]|uniref:Secreted protein n=1 Tax=Linnemannia gamsii TaxID=64522 RepID=A0ABQ7KB82_9FUNG|nr:hypothetical protein BGZ96_000110 [Linnemannia gamsii]